MLPHAISIRSLLGLALAAALAASCSAPPPAQAQRILFDARHGQTAGNADWIVDADSSEVVWLNFQCSNPRRHHSGQRFPSPAQSAITATTPETVWDGGISAWAVALAKDALGAERDWVIEQYAWDAPEMTFGDPGNPQDLAEYDVLVLCEPNVLFTDGEAQAIRDFVHAGGGLFLCADHETSDRNCSGGGTELHDSPFILNRMMETRVTAARDPPYLDPMDPRHDFGVFGIWFYENGIDDSGNGANRAFDWFTEAVNDNVADHPDDPILHGRFGDGTGGLGLFGSTQMAISTDPAMGNPSARGHVFRSGATKAANALGVVENVTFASATFGAGRVVAVGDSSPADDGTGEGPLHRGWDKAGGGVANHVIFLNATDWLAGAGGGQPVPVPVPIPVPVPGPVPEPAPGPAPGLPGTVELSGWRLASVNPAFSFTFPPGTRLAAGGRVVGRDAERAAFEAEWGPLPAEVAYVSAGGGLLINSSSGSFTLLDASGEVVDGPTIRVRAGRSAERTDGCGEAGAPATWRERPRSAADPGRGGPPACGAGVVIVEIADADDFRNEWVEIGFDPAN